jgi:heme/copper-type cytochrome/quinol oxidase subunit 2
VHASFDNTGKMAMISGMNARRFLSVGLALFLVLAGEALACVGCRTTGETLGDPQKIIQAGIAFSWSVLFMLVVVFTAVSGLVVFLVRTCRAVDARHQMVRVRK